MSDDQEIIYDVDSCAGRTRYPFPGPTSHPPVPRIARLLALALRFDGLLRDGTIRDYAELARLGRVTRARITQIMGLLDLAPDIQEQILFLPDTQGLNERNLRPHARLLDWGQQRRRFQKLMCQYRSAGGLL
jgi:hypothetical protein